MRKVLALIVLGLAAASLFPSPVVAGGGPHCEGLSDDTTNTVGLSMNCFVPTVARIEPGEKVRFVNKDAVLHTVTGTQLRWGGDLTNLAEGDSVTYRFDDEGIYPYTCVLHPGMVGAVVVGDGQGSGFATMTGGSVTWSDSSKASSRITTSDDPAGSGITPATARGSQPTWSFIGVAAMLAVLALLATAARPGSAGSSVGTLAREP